METAINEIEEMNTTEVKNAVVEATKHSGNVGAIAAGIVLVAGVAFGAYKGIKKIAAVTAEKKEAKKAEAKRHDFCVKSSDFEDEGED